MSQFSYNKIAAAALTVLAAGLASTALAQSSGFGPAPALAPADRHLIESAATDAMAEVALGKLAQSKATSDPVKQFGARMAQDHSKANAELKALAASRNIALPAALDKTHQKQLDELGKASSTRFDHEYMELMVSEHKKDVAEFRKQSQSAKDPAIKSFAAKTLPTLEEHLKLAESTKAALK
jgi:putative membrane protein